MKHNYIEDNFS